MENETMQNKRRIEARKMLVKTRVLLYRLSLVGFPVADNAAIARICLELDYLERGEKWY